MNRLELEGKWNKIKGSVKQKYGEWFDDDQALNLMNTLVEFKKKPAEQKKTLNKRLEIGKTKTTIFNGSLNT